jgi:hypothetical protein
MLKSSDMTRKEFLKAVVACAGAGAAASALLTACGGSPSPDNLGGPSCRANGAKDGVITGNHGHSLSVPAADVQAGVAKTYSIQGASSHPHSITIGADQFAILAQNGGFTVTSTTDAGHMHSVTVTCI